ncbi:hypothetical protein DICPUDRAFT_83564 [Dictyostelium purpureum]|uniref:Anaphase-promoting complex subunit 5 n=1 Tax=Dictyostelium purpureum TaxID=5786 RepID=F0ZZW6_DICPU|nr:uncharacterized protein DICPUDRAFT_83564 [Dictyostelium purpureum]EGC30511.1 hypothetical protein DICPUDRAFT_83564 [Dictyostelium purpureum]|eukprot:XP_003292959.1 hypothetical protein DICPUDRAFT_83564 [Dictyostelium purpureum]
MDKYRLTPHKITICILIDYYITGNINYHHKQALSHLLIKHVKETNYNDLGSELSLYEFIDKELRTVLPLQFLNNEFLEMVQFDSIDDIYGFMSQLKNLFQPIGADENGNSGELKNAPLLDFKSILGSFVKKVLLNFNQILFDGLIKLYDQLTQYLNDFYSEAERRLKEQEEEQEETNRNNISQNMDESIDDMEDIENNDNDTEKHQKHQEKKYEENEFTLSKIKLKFLSPLDEEKFVYEETVRINSMIGKVDPKEIDFQINQLKQALPNVKRVHLISLLSNIEYQDYESSLEDLHRYFDYVNGQVIVNQSNLSGSIMDTTNVMLPYAVLNLVKLHYHFGNFEESYLALREAIRIAQERGDHSCLALADHWLARLLKKSVFNSMESPNLLQYLLVSHNDIEILKKSIDRAGNLDMPDLLALNHLAFSKFKLENGELSNNNKMNSLLNYNFNNLINSGGANNNSGNNNNNNNNNSNSNNTGNNNSSVSSVSSTWSDIFQPIEISKLLDKTPNNTTVAHYLYSTAWELLGNNDLAQFFTELAMKTYLANSLSLQRDPLRSISTNYQINSKNGYYPNNSEEPDLVSYCKLALLLSKKSKYKEAIQTLVKCFSIYRTQFLCGNLLSFTTLTILFDYLIENNATPSTTPMISTTIESLINLTNRFQSDDSKDGPGWYQILLVYQKIIKYYIYQRGMYEKAFNLLIKAIGISKDFGLDSQTPYLYTLLSKIYEHTPSPFSGLSDTLYALSVSNHYHLQQSIAESNIALIKIHINANRLPLAENLIQETLPFVVSNNNLYSELYILWSKCILSSPAQALDYLSKSENLITLNNTNENNNNNLLKEIYYLKSLIYNNLNDIGNRNLNAKKFKLFSKQQNEKPKTQQQQQQQQQQFECTESPKIGLISPALVNPIMKIR